jgi:archaemetzincin
MRPQKFYLEFRRNEKTGKRQLQVNSILVNLKRKIPNDALCLIALTMEDLYQAPNDLFVAGMAAGNHRVAVFSFYRYDPSMAFSIEHWWDTEKNISVDEEERMKMIIQRSCKLLVHEVSHILGVDHCIFFSCCMNGSGHLKEDFSQAMHLCPVDLHKLNFLCGFDINERYRMLLDFFQKYDLKEELDWVERRLEYLDESI